MSAEYREKAVVFGSEQNLVGIVCSGGSAAGSPTVAVIILNAGVVHRVGPGRLGVRLSRELAGLGMTSLRFDLSGIGDSVARRGNLSLEEGVVKDVEEAMAYLEQTHDVESFVFAGLCSGAREAFRTAHRDERVVGAVMIDPIVFRTRRFYLQHYGRKLASAGAWKNALSGGTRYLGRVRHDLLEDLRSDRDRGDVPEIGPAGLPAWPTRNQFAQALDRVLSRGVRLLFLYTGGMDYKYREQFADAFPEAAENPLLQVEHFPDADHIISSEDERAKLLRRIGIWLEGCGFHERVRALPTCSASHTEGT